MTARGCGSSCAAQRDQYLPLKVIKAQLDAQPDGELPDAGSRYGGPRLVSDADRTPGSCRASAVAPDPGAGSAARTCWSSPASPMTLLTALVRNGVITPVSKGAGAVYFDEHSVVIAQCARALADYGVEPRHLRAFRSAADRQSDLIAQIAGPLVKADKAGARDRADDLAREVAALAITLHTSLIKSAVRDVLHR